jgi:predicted RecB family nuclease
VEADDLSLLSGLRPNELAAAQKKGIFTVTQFSYTFRPSRRGKRIRHDWALQALSIREKRTHVLRLPDIPEPTQPMRFFDVEGDPEANSYYLAGVLVVSEKGRATQR